MKRRLYFLLPDTAHTRAAVNDLKVFGINNDAMRHGELLLMVDVPVWRVERVEALVHKHHPEAVVGGVGWHIDALHI
jgi:hypothetical protein